MKGYVVQVNFDGDIKGEGTFVFIGGRAECNMRTFVANKLRVLALYYFKRFGYILKVTDEDEVYETSLVQATNNGDWMDEIVEQGGYENGNYSVYIYEIDDIIDSNDIVLDMEVLK